MANAADGFRPPSWLAGGHRQTLVGYLLRHSLRWRLPAGDLPVDAGKGVRLLLRASWQDGRHEDHPALLIVHGLGDGSPTPAAGTSCA